MCVSVCFCVTFGGDTDPVQVPGELLGDVGLPPGRKSHHDDHRGRVGELRHRRWETHTQRRGKESCHVFYVRVCVCVLHCSQPPGWQRIRMMKTQHVWAGKVLKSSNSAEPVSAAPTPADMTQRQRQQVRRGMGGGDTWSGVNGRPDGHRHTYT